MSFLFHKQNLARVQGICLLHLKGQNSNMFKHENIDTTHVGFRLIMSHPLRLAIF